MITKPRTIIGIENGIETFGYFLWVMHKKSSL
jgi:hypothetical protein